MERLADAGFRWRGASRVGQVRSGYGCAKPMIGYGIGSRSADFATQGIIKKDKRVIGPIGEEGGEGRQ